MGGMSSSAAHRLHTVFQLSHPGMSLSCPGAGELHPLVVVIRQIHAKAHGCRQMQILLPSVHKSGTPGNDPSFCKDGVGQLQAKPCHPILQRHSQCLRLIVSLRVGGRKSFQRQLPFHYPVFFINKIRDPASALLQNLHSRGPVIPCSVRRILLLDMFKGKRLVAFKHAGRHGPGQTLQQIGKILPVMYPFSKIELSQMSAGKHLHDITDLFIIKMKCPVLFSPYHTHLSSASCLKSLLPLRFTASTIIYKRELPQQVIT